MTNQGVLVLAPYPNLDGRWLVLWVERRTDGDRARVLAVCPRVFANRSDAFQHAVNQARDINGDPRRTRKGTKYRTCEQFEAYVLHRGEHWACGSGEQWKVAWEAEK